MLKKRILTLLFVGLLSSLALFFEGCKKTDEVVVTVNGVSVRETEFQLAMSHLRSEVVLHFSQEYAETDFSDAFWKKEYGENKETPIQVLKEKAAAELTEKHIVLSFAKNRGLIAEDDFEYIQKNHQKENASREEQLKNGETIYGVTKFELWDYYDWYVSNCMVQLRNRELQNISEEDVKKYYDENKEEIFTTDAVLQCREYEIPLEAYGEEAEVMAQNIYAELEKGVAFDKAGSAYGLQAKEKSYHMSAEKGLSVMLPQLLECLQQLEVGEIQLVAEQASYYVLTLDRKEATEYKTVEQAAGQIKTLIAKERVATEVEEMLYAAKVEKLDKYHEIDISMTRE